jgi:hypothetical protein
VFWVFPPESIAMRCGTPHTLHPAPRTLQPAPCTPRLAPRTLHSAPRPTAAPAPASAGRGAVRRPRHM